MSGYDSPPGKRLSSDRRAEVIREAAAKVFAARGYDRASMREIAREAGVTTPVLYDHYASKGALYAATVEMQANLLVSQWVSSDPTSMSPQALFELSTEAFFRAVGSSAITWRLLFEDRPSAPEAVAVNNEVQAFATEAVAAALRQLPTIDNPLLVDTERAYYALAEAVKGAGHAVLGWWKSNQDVPIEQVIALTNRVLWNGLDSMIIKFEDRAGTAPDTVEIHREEQDDAPA